MDQHRGATEDSDQFVARGTRKTGLAFSCIGDDQAEAVNHFFLSTRFGALADRSTPLLQPLADDLPQAKRLRRCQPGPAIPRRSEQHQGWQAFQQRLSHVWAARLSRCGSARATAGVKPTKHASQAMEETCGVRPAPSTRTIAKGCMA